MVFLVLAVAGLSMATVSTANYNVNGHTGQDWSWDIYHQDAFKDFGSNSFRIETAFTKSALFDIKSHHGFEGSQYTKYLTVKAVRAGEATVKAGHDNYYFKIN